MNPYLFRRIRGPVLLVAFAVTALLAQWGILGWLQSLPVYLIALGLLRLAEAAVLLASPALPLPYGASRYQQNRWNRRRSFAGGVVLLLIGVVSLLVTTGVLGSFFVWQVFGVWWPVLLILVGVLLLVERLAGRRGAYGPDGVYYGRPRLGGGLVLLLVLLAVFGIVAHGARSWNGPLFNGWNWNGNGDWNWNWGGEHYTHTVTLARSIPADAVLTIQNANGDLQLGPSADGQIHVEATQVANVPERRRQRAFDATTPQLSVKGGSVELDVPARDNVTVSLALSVPSGVLCTIHNHHGDLAVSGLTRPIEIDQDHGDVVLDSLGGSAKLRMDHGDVHVRALTGDLTIDGRTGDVTASGITGRADLHGEFFGATSLEQMGGAVDFDSSRTQLHVQQLTGNLSLDGSDLAVSGVRGGLRISTHSKDVEVTALSGDAQIADSNGDLSVTLAKPLGTVSLHDDTGDVVLSVPQGLPFSLSGNNGADDDFQSDYAMTQATDGDQRTFHGQVGSGGPQMSVEVRHGDVTLRRIAPDLLAPAPSTLTQPSPAGSAPPAAPRHPMRHLHTDGATPETTPA